MNTPAQQESQTQPEYKMSSKNLDFYYGDFKALQDINMYFKPQEVTALIGPSGCGKSTFLRCLNRMNDLIPISRVDGEITLDGDDIYAPDVDVVMLRRKVGMVFQKPNPFPKSIFDNVAYGLWVNGIKDKTFVQERVEESLKQAAIWDEVKDRLQDTALGLSGGQQQRLCIARALAVKAGSGAHGRAGFGPGPYRHPEDRRVDSPTQGNLHDYYRDPQHAAGRAGVGRHGVFLHRQADRGRRYGHDFHPAEEKADRGLHYRSLRLIHCACPMDGVFVCRRMETVAWPPSNPKKCIPDYRKRKPNVKHFQRELDKVKKMILSLGALVEQRVNQIRQAIEDRDVELAKKIMHLDHEIDDMEVEIEEECLKIIALHQPVAADLRFLVAVIKINNDLERIGDQVVNIAQRVVRIAKRPVAPFNFDYSEMAAKAEAMLRMSLDSLVNQDLDAAIKVLHLDDEVDKFKDEAYDRIKQAMADGITDDIGYMINLLLISRHIERLADHATNIAEEVAYMIEGEIVRHGRLE